MRRMPVGQIARQSGLRLVLSEGTSPPLFKGEVRPRGQRRRCRASGANDRGYLLVRTKAFFLLAAIFRVEPEAPGLMALIRRDAIGEPEARAGVPARAGLEAAVVSRDGVAERALAPSGIRIAGWMKPAEVLFCWLATAISPAHSGATALVPPITKVLPSTRMT